MNTLVMSLTQGWYDGRWGGGPGGWHGGWSDGGGWWWIAWPLGWLVFLALLGVGVWLVVRALRRSGAVGGTPSPTEGARRILAERFARGEIDEEEYQNRLAGLS